MHLSAGSWAPAHAASQDAAGFPLADLATAVAVLLVLALAALGIHRFVRLRRGPD
jgi:hypothetical protein